MRGVLDVCCMDVFAREIERGWMGGVGVGDGERGRDGGWEMEKGEGGKEARRKWGRKEETNGSRKQDNKAEASVTIMPKQPNRKNLISYDLSRKQTRAARIVYWWNAHMGCVL